jgi:hypothetical protein
MKSLATASLIVAGLILLSGAAWSKEKKSIDEYDAVYNIRDWKCEIDGNKAVVKVHNRITVKNRRGDDYGYIHLTDTRYSQLKDANITISDTTGKVINRYGKKDLRKACGYGASYALYEDICHYFTDAAVATFPYVVDLNYTREYKSLFYLRGPLLVGDIPVENGSYTVVFPASMQLHCKQYGTDIPRIDESRGDRNIWRWEVTNQLPPKKESLSRFAVSRAGMVEICADNCELEKYRISGMSWQNIGALYNEMAEDQYDRDGWPKDGVYRTDSLPEIIRNTYDKVRKSTRYVAVEIGIGGLRPHEAEKTRKCGYGDCKDLSTLLISDLRKQGVHAQPVLVLTRDAGVIDTTFPNDEFNHVITAVPAGADTFWLDPTCSGCTFGDLPSMDEDIDVLLIDETGGHLVRTPGSDYRDNQVVRTARVSLDSKLNLSLMGSLTYTGNYAHGLWAELSSKKQEELNRFVDDRLGDVRTPLIVKDVEVEDSGDTDSSVTVRFRAFGKKPLSLLQSTAYLKASPFYQGRRTNSQDIEDLERPLSFRFPMETIDSVTFFWDSSLAVDSVIAPPDTVLDESYSLISTHCIVYNDSLMVVVHDARTVYSIPPEEFDAFLKFEDAAEQIDKQYAKLTLTKR